MKASVNFRFLIGVIVCVVLLGAATHGLHAIQVNHQSSFLLDRARYARDQQEFQLAVSRYQQYAKMAPGDIDASVELGNLLADLHSGKSAVAAFEKVLRAQPGRTDVRRRLVRIEMELHRFGDAKFHLLEHLLKSSPEDGSLWDLLGTCQAESGEFPDAAESFRTAIKKSPQQLDAYRHLADVLRQNLKHGPEADKSMEALVRANPDSAPAHAIQGKYLAMHGQTKPALEQAESALKLDPKNTDALLLAATLAISIGEYDQARADAKRAIESDPKLAGAYITLANIERLHGDLTKAIACLEAGVDKTAPKNDELLWRLGRLEVEAEDLTKAQAIVGRLHKLRTNKPAQAQSDFDPQIDLLQAQIEFGRGNWRQAAEQFELVAPRLARSMDLEREVHMYLANCYERLGNPDLELIAYREAARVDPLWPPARLGIAATLSSLGKRDEALQEYREVNTLGGKSEAAGTALVRLLILKNLETAKPDWAEANAVLDRLETANPDSISVILSRVDALVSQQRTSVAEQVLSSAGRKTPDRPELWSARIVLAQREQQWDRATQLIETAKQRFGDQVWLRLTEGGLLLAKSKKESAPQLQALGDGAESFPQRDQFRLYRGLTALLLEAGDTARARKLCRLACDAGSQDLRSRSLRFDLAVQAGDAADAKQALQEIRDVEGEGPLWHCAQAALTLVSESGKKGVDDSAFQHLAKAAELRPGWARVPLLAARLYDSQGQFELALASYLKAIGLGERNPTAVRRAVELLYSQQRYAEADKILRQMEQQHNLVSNELDRLDSEISARLDNLDRALGIAQRVAADSKDWHAHLWLGQLLALLGQRAQASKLPQDSKTRFADAERSLRKAVELAPEVPETWVALIRFFAAADRKQDATAMISEAARRLPPDAAPLALGPCYEALGDLAEAAKQYQTALAQAPNNPLLVRRAAEFSLRTGQAAEADSYLRRIVSGDVIADPADVLWARRALASTLVNSGSYQKIQQALVLLDQNLAAGSAADDQLEKARALARCPEANRKQEAVKILEKQLATQPDSAEVRLALAQLYLNAKDWPHAAQQMRSLLSSHGQEPRYVALYVSKLLERKEIQEAELWLPRLEQLAPHDFSTVSLNAQALVHHDQIDPAIQRLREYLVQPAGEPADRPTRAQQVAACLELLAAIPTGPDRETAVSKLLAEAETQWRDFVKQQPDKELALATFLARRGRLDEALSVAERAWPAADTQTIAIATHELIGSVATEASQTERLEKLLRVAAEKHGRPASLLLELGNLQIHREHLDDAETTYRELLKKDDANALAMNNLAVLLSLQKKNLEEASRLIERAIELVGPLPPVLDTRASLFMAQGQPERALADLDVAVKAEPRPNWQFHRALAYWRLGQTKAAVDALEEARKSGLKPEQLNPLERPEYLEISAKIHK